MKQLLFAILLSTIATGASAENKSDAYMIGLISSRAGMCSRKVEYKDAAAFDEVNQLARNVGTGTSQDMVDFQDGWWAAVRTYEATTCATLLSDYSRWFKARD